MSRAGAEGLPALQESMAGSPRHKPRLRYLESTSTRAHPLCMPAPTPGTTPQLDSECELRPHVVRVRAERLALPAPVPIVTDRHAHEVADHVLELDVFPDVAEVRIDEDELL